MGHVDYQGLYYIVLSRMYVCMYVCTYFRLFKFIFRVRGREEEREGEKPQYVVASHVAPTGDLACNPGMFPD